MKRMCAARLTLMRTSSAVGLNDPLDDTATAVASCVPIDEKPGAFGKNPGFVEHPTDVRDGRYAVNVLPTNAEVVLGVCAGASAREARHTYQCPFEHTVGSSRPDQPHAPKTPWYRHVPEVSTAKQLA
jgi:hypothetical protein